MHGGGGKFERYTTRMLCNILFLWFNLGKGRTRGAHPCSESFSFVKGSWFESGLAQRDRTTDY